MIFNENLGRLYERALRYFGVRAQSLMLVEEMAELTQAIIKAERHGLDNEINRLVEEFVDVEIMLEQFEIILSERFERFEEERAIMRYRKLSRLEEMLDKEAKE